MAIKINGTTVINDSRELSNITNLKTIGGNSILGTGDITISSAVGGAENIHAAGTVFGYIVDPTTGTGLGRFSGLSVATSDNYVAVTGGTFYNILLIDIKSFKIIKKIQTVASRLGGIRLTNNYIAVNDYGNPLYSGKIDVYNIEGQFLYNIANPSTADTTDEFSESFDLTDEYLVIGAEGEDTNGINSSGKVYIYETRTKQLVRTLIYPDTLQTSIRFGQVIKIDKKTKKRVIVSSPGKSQVHIFDMNSGHLITTITGTSGYFALDGNLQASVSMYGNYAIVGSYGNNAAYLYRVSDGALMATITDPNPVTNGYFGLMVDISENTVVISAFDNNTDTPVIGRCYFYDITNPAAPKLTATVTNPNVDTTSGDDHFGVAVALSDSYAFVAASEEDVVSTNKGVLYKIAARDILNAVDVESVTFTNSKKMDSMKKALELAHNQGEYIHSLYNPNAYSTRELDEFGKTLSMFGNRLAVGVPLEDDAGGLDAGKVYVFDVTTGKLVYRLDNPSISNSSSGDYFGFDVALSDKYLAVGAINEDVTGTNYGIVYVYEANTGALLYRLDNIYNVNPPQNFGGSLSISGNFLAVGQAPLAITSSGGHEFIEVYNLDTRARLYRIACPNLSEFQGFGRSVFLRNNRLIVGSTEETSASGKAYIYDLEYYRDYQTELFTLTNPNNFGSSASDRFGMRVTCSDRHCLVSAILEDSAESGSSGVVYVYDIFTGSLLYTLTNPNIVQDDFSDLFGHSIAATNDYFVIGAPGEGDIGWSGSTINKLGKIYIYDANTGKLLKYITNPLFPFDVQSNSSWNSLGVYKNEFGASIAVNDNYIAVGSYEADNVVESINREGIVTIHAIKNLTYLDKIQNLVS